MIMTLQSEYSKFADKDTSCCAESVNKVLIGQTQKADVMTSLFKLHLSRLPGKFLFMR